MTGWTIDGRRLRALREESGSRIAVFAALAGCHFQHYRKIELYGQQPSGILARRIARALSAQLGRDITLNDFATPKTDEAAAA